MDTGTTILISVCSLLLGAYLRHRFGRSAIQHQHLLEARGRAYTDFCQAYTALIAVQRTGEQEEEFEAIARVNDAKTRVCIFGSEEVVHHFENVRADGIRHETKEEMEALASLYVAIRKSLGIRDRTSVYDALYHCLSPRKEDRR